MFSHIQHAQDAHHSQPFLHPHDPNVEKEYETLIQAWKNQLIDKTPTSPSYEYIRFAWMRLMDHYLDQQWLDSKQMLQCAQAWSARDSISITEAVHTMNILSLKSMQRSLDARQELLQALGDPDFMVGFGVPPIDTTLNPLSGTEAQDEDDDDEEEEDRQVHAPLLVKHNNTPVEESFNILHEEEDEAIITTDSKPEETDNQDDLIELDHQVFKQQGFRLTSSSSTPNISLRSSQDDFSFNKSGFNRKYESYYQQLNQASCWKEMEMKQEEVSITSDDQSIYSDHSDINEHVNGNGIQWKSWFVDEQPDNQQQPLLAPDEPIIFEQEFADEKVETDACLAELYNPQPKKNQPFLMVRSESSISAFRPISNNLAPRCQQLNPLQVIKRSSSSTSIEKAESHHQPLQLPVAATITKSRSFPTKASLSASFKTAPSSPAASSPPPMPTHSTSTSTKERNFMIRSIVGKKVSLSKLFGSRKSSSSSSSSSHH